MKNLKYDGEFSKDLLCIKLQLETLFENVGGENCINLLNLLSNLTSQERDVVIEKFCNIIQKLLSTTQRKKSLKDVSDEEFENDLYGNLEEAFNNMTSHPVMFSQAPSRFKVVNGGKNKFKRKILKFNDFF